MINMLVEFKACETCLCVSCCWTYDCPKAKGYVCVDCSGNPPKSEEECEYYEMESYFKNKGE